MSHKPSMTIGRTVSHDNRMFLLTLNGVLNCPQLVVGIGCTISLTRELMIFYDHFNVTIGDIKQDPIGLSQLSFSRCGLFFLLMTTTFMINTFILCLSHLVPRSSSSLISKSTYEIWYHFIAFLLLFSAAIAFSAELPMIANFKPIHHEEFAPKATNIPHFPTTKIFGFGHALLHLASVLWSYLVYRRG